MRWLALCCRPDAPAGDSDALAWLALSFTPRVARLEEAVVAEVAASLRLFGGARALRQRLQAEAARVGLGLGAQAWGPTALAALALARCPEPARQGRLAERLDALPLAALSAAQAHHAMLARLGCRQLGELRRLPRAALARRFGPALLSALDQAYGDLPEAHDWLTLPERFDARLELPYRVEHAPVLLHFAETLLRQLCAFLAARHAGVRTLRLAWQHDAMRPRDVAGSGALTVATADTTRDLQRLSRLLAEHLARTTLAAPAGEIQLGADTLLPLEEQSAGLLPGRTAPQERTTTNALLERLSVRLGAGRVREGRLHEDHRLAEMQRWQPWPAPPMPPNSAPVRRPPGPQPTWLVEPPQPLRCDAQEQPLYAGPLVRVSGPHRIEAGWWQSGGLQARDYFVYRSPARGLLWVYHERFPDAASTASGWFLHGVFA
ncbi:DNA polymerase Y family protein [Roseateles saccharophilus]|uniref:Protein ImuB n=1 Tax=Roseateles saccharophilus TaxID=304 RepID=A0A4R3VEH5_ROSSA|nr:DNA polymerase Y family protein [Roseateles saccharophilus]MDG0836222.1 DNA polymerase Y family protein [Roseateles saccharophilus]TCV02029.1 protein ImuB [Roseateles saccharophilus]